MNKANLALAVFSVLASAILAGCSSHKEQEAPTADQKQSFVGTPDPAAQARDAANFAASQKKNAPGAGASGTQTVPASAP